MFIPNTNKYPYPEDTSGHYLEVKMDRGIVFDKNYPYVDYSKGFAFKRFWVHVLLRLIVFPLAKVRFGIKVEGKSNLKRYKDLLSNGAVTVCNHVHMWDYICIMKALHNFKWTYLLSWDKNINGDSGPLVRMVGGIPIPEGDIEAQVAFNHAIKKLLEEKNFLHVYAEGSMWEYYSPISPFKRGAASIAVHNDKPILPMAYTYRKPGFIRGKLFKLPGCFTLHIGEPLLANKDLDKTTQIDDLTLRAHEAVCALAGFDKSLYEPIYHHSKRKNA